MDIIDQTFFDGNCHFLVDVLCVKAVVSTLSNPTDDDKNVQPLNWLLKNVQKIVFTARKSKLL